MQKNKSSRPGKKSKFETGTLSQRGLNNIDESWKVIGNLKSGMRDLEQKLNKYSENIKLLSSISNTSFNSTAHSFNMPTESTNKIFTSTSLNSALKPTEYKKSPSRYTIAEKPIFENSYLSSTIQACDPGLGFYDTCQYDYENFSKNDYNEPYEYSPNVQCLNDFSNDFNTSYINFDSKPSYDFIKQPKMTKVDVYVPSDKNFRADQTSKHHSSMISKEKLTRKIASDGKRLTSEDVKYDFGQPSSASFHQQRVLHKDTDVLPVSSATKRHLSSASFSNPMDIRHHESKPTSRKTAFPKHDEADEPKNLAKMNVKEETDRLLGLSTSAKRSKRPEEPKNSALITTNLAQKHIKSEPDKSILYQVQYNPRSTSAPLNQSPQALKKPKRTECHLVQAAKPASTSATKTSSLNSPQLNKNKSKPYDLNDIHKYIQSQKSKRLHETKSEKEKQKIQDEERKKKLQELYRKQRLQAIKSAQITNSASKLNNSNEKNCQNNSNNSSKVYEQDMSKLLMDRISHLLNDNDKLVEKQRKQILKVRKKVDFGSEDFGENEHEPEQNESSTSSASLSTVNNSANATPKQSQKTTSLKHDRLKKICSMALDLQTKLQQTKLKLFGFNPTDEEDMIDYYKKNENTFVTSTKHEDEENEFMQELDGVQFDRVFKQDVRENKNYGQSSEDYELSGDEVSRPGVANLKKFKYTLTPDLAARRIQHAYRLYRARRKAIAAQRPPRKLKKENIRPSSLKSDQILALNNQKDAYGFLNVYKKKSGFGTQVSSSVTPVSVHHQTKVKHETNNYTDDFMTYNETKIGETDRLSTIKSSLSSSSDSTSLSKYIASSKNSKHNKMSKSAEIQQVQDESYESPSSVTSSSVSSNSTVTSSHGKTVPSTSRQKSIRSEQPTQTVHQPIHQPVQSQKPKTRMVQEPESKEPKRYSPASLERLLHAGINYLDTLNTSAVQLEELDKIKCIGFAQQDTVALAQYLKEKQNLKQEVKSEKFPKSRSSSLTSNTSSSSSGSTTVSSSSYNETETELKNTKSSTKRSNELTKSRNKSSFVESKDIDQDISIINTVSELNDTKTDTRIKTEIDDEDIEMEKSFRQVLPSEMHIKKTRQDYKDLKDQSHYDLSQSSISQYESNPSMRLSFDEDSFKKFTGEIVKKYMHEEELRSKHQADLLKLREKALVEKTKSELAWLEQMKKKAQDKGEDEKMPLILRKEKGIIQKLKQEQDNINKMKEVQRKVAESRLKLLSQHSEVVKWCQKKLKRHSLNQSYKGNENENDETSSASNAASSSAESGPTPALSSSSINQEPDQLDDLSFNLNNQSLIESKIMKQYQLNTEKYLTEREKKLRQRRKHAEELLAWKKKLDDEELRVREIEKKANQVLKKKTLKLSPKSDKKTKSEHEEPDSEEVEEDVATDVIKTESKIGPHSTKTIATSIQENSYAESFDSSTISTVQEIKTKNLTKKSRDDSQSNLIATSLLNSVPTQLNNSMSKADTRDDDTTKDSSSSSLSELTGTTPSSSTSSSVRELEKKVKELKNEYLKKKNEAEKLGKMLKEAEKLKIKEKEEQLRKKIESYDNKLEKIKSALNKKEKINEKISKPIEDEEVKSLSSSTSDDAKSSSAKPTSTGQRYEDDFESERPNSEARQIEDEEKSTVSEISEELMGNTASQSNMKLEGIEDQDENSTSINSSTDTQILILGSSRQTKDKEQSESEIEKFRQQDMAIQSFLKSYLDQVIDQMIEVKNSKTNKLIAEQYRETMEELDEEGSIEDEHESEQPDDDLMSTQNIKIPIPPIDLDEDLDEDGKPKKMNESQNESKPVVLNVPYEREKVTHLVDQAIQNYYWKHLNNLKQVLETNSKSTSLYDEKSLDEFFRPDADFKEPESSFKKMILDLTGELMYDLYLERFEQADVVSEFLPGHLRPLKKKHFKSYLKGPSDLTRVKDLVGKKVLDLFKLSADKENKMKVKSKWRIQKKLDLVDGLLDVEMREQEHEWSNYEIEEYEAKLLISNSVFDLILKDTIDCVQSTIIKKNSM